MSTNLVLCKPSSKGNKSLQELFKLIIPEILDQNYITGQSLHYTHPILPCSAKFYTNIG